MYRIAVSTTTFAIDNPCALPVWPKPELRIVSAFGCHHAGVVVFAAPFFVPTGAAMIHGPDPQPADQPGEDEHEDKPEHESENGEHEGEGEHA
jgi:hypothetical protein